MVIDDDRDMRLVLMKYLQKFNYQMLGGRLWKNRA